MPEKTLKLPASAATVQDPVTQPLGPATVSGTTYTVDFLVNNPTVIPGIIRTLVAGNRGYFADKIFNSPNIPVNGGVVIGEPTKPNELFLPEGKSLAPRAPGAEAPRVGATRGEPQLYFPESWSGSLEITNEAKRRNQTYTITRQMTQIANTFTNIIQKRAVEILLAFCEAESSARTKANKTNWVTAAEAEAAKIKASESPAVDLAYVLSLFELDEAGYAPKWMILHPNDALLLNTIFGVQGVGPLLDYYGLTMVPTPRITEGEAFFVAESGIGDLLWEQPLQQETEYVARRKTTVTTLEAVPVFVPLDYLGVWRLTGLRT